MPKHFVIIQHQKKILEMIRNYFPDSKVVFFAAEKIDEERPTDFCICIDDGHQLSLTEFMGMIKEVWALRLPYKIDFYDWFDVSAELQKHIDNFGVLQK